MYLEVINQGLTYRLFFLFLSLAYLCTRQTDRNVIADYELAIVVREKCEK